LPDPTAVYDGSDNGDLYFSFTSGHARFIILDVMSGPLDDPSGRGQFTRLTGEDTLASSHGPRLRLGPPS
jgi:hypothetical protein